MCGLSVRLVDAEASRDCEWIVAAQVETWFKSYGRRATATEVAALTGRLQAAFIAKDSDILVFFEGTSRVGYVWIEARPDRQWFVLDLWLEPAARGRGLGRRLLNAIEARETEAANSELFAELRLAVADDNEAAMRLFAAAGFQVVESQVREGKLWFEMRRTISSYPGSRIGS